MRTHIPDFDGLKHYLGVLHMGDHVVLIVKALYKLTWGSIHRHLGVIVRYLFQGVRDLSIYVGYETLFHVYLHLKWSGQKTTEACDWVIGTHISDKWRPYAKWFDRYMCVLLRKNKLRCLYINISIFSFELLTTV